MTKRTAALILAVVGVIAVGVGASLDLGPLWGCGTVVAGWGAGMAAAS